VSRNSYGEIVFRGRKDSLIKHLGYRIELGEVEHVIVNNLKMVGNACALYDYGKKEIALVYEHTAEIPVAEFRKGLMHTLPKYMIPTLYHYMDALPRNSNGKIDRALLKEKFV
jgi:acyl-coenzyme A synthetase/AMP-(fatty) acid ligase